MGNFDKFILLIKDSKKFFSSVKNESLTEAIKFYIITFLIGQIVSIFFVMYLTIVGGFFLGIFTLLIIPALVLAGLVSVVIWSLVLHLIGLIFEIKGNFNQTMKIVAYSLAPYNIFLIVPYIGALSILFSYYVQVIGFMNLHKVSSGKALAIVLLPMILSMVLITLAIVMMVLAFFTISSASSQISPLPTIVTS